ncbi:hypothetical protein FLAVO9AF_960014 [Flavobacterium sp. 9AF]|nr:hypothetical protein FLAVO9AF_960014 [Flavobacterium sp. 9AF]
MIKLYFLDSLLYIIKLPQIPNPTSKYKPAKINNTLAALGLFLRTIKPKRLSKIGGPTIINIKKKTNPPKFPTSNVVIY